MRLQTCILVAIALSLANGALAAAPSSWDRATQLYESGNYSAALAELNRISSSSASNPSVHYLIGVCYKHLGKFDQARKELSWVARYASDANTKDMAQSELADLPAAGSRTSPTVAASRPSSGGGTSGAPAKVLVNDSVSQTISAAAAKGWRPCPGGCLNVSSPDWHHEHVDDHPDTEVWHTFPGSHNPNAVTTGHWGQMFAVGADGNEISKGACPTCGGTGWVRSN